VAVVFGPARGKSDARRKAGRKSGVFLGIRGRGLRFAKALRAGGKTGNSQWFLVEQQASESVGAASGMLPPEASGALMLSSHVAYRVTKSLFLFYIAWKRVVFKSQPLRPFCCMYHGKNRFVFYVALGHPAGKPAPVYSFF
jgi:hypothetical protein